MTPDGLRGFTKPRRQSTRKILGLISKCKSLEIVLTFVVLRILGLLVCRSPGAIIGTMARWCGLGWIEPLLRRSGCSNSHLSTCTTWPNSLQIISLFGSALMMCIVSSTVPKDLSVLKRCGSRMRAMKGWYILLGI